MLLSKYVIKGKCDSCSRTFEVSSIVSMEDALKKSRHVRAVRNQRCEPMYWEVLPAGTTTCTLCQWSRERHEEGIKKNWPLSRRNSIYLWREMSEDETDRDERNGATCDGKSEIYVKSRCGGGIRYHQKVGVSHDYLCEKHFRHPPKQTKEFKESKRMSTGCLRTSSNEPGIGGR